MLSRRVRDSNTFTYHRYCSNLNIINICFADDLFLFAHGDVDSDRVIMDYLDEFKNASGLTLSLPKSTAYFCNVLNYVKLGILNILPFKEGKLPVKYLGVPLVPSLPCWASVFILPSSLMLELEQVMRGLLWCQGEMKKGKAKVAWEVVCLPKKEGGLGPFSNVISNRDIYRAGFSLDSKVADIISHGEWAWPIEWQFKYPNLASATFPLLSNAADGITLRNLSNQEEGFLVSAIWECIRP
ncbi:hypothetical protein Tco_1518089 [Tanacetum coccineum]